MCTGFRPGPRRVSGIVLIPHFKIEPLVTAAAEISVFHPKDQQKSVFAECAVDAS